MFQILGTDMADEKHTFSLKQNRQLIVDFINGYLKSSTFYHIYSTIEKYSEFLKSD